ncbi:MAG: iron compound ABC transporter ATP-binding protein [Parcubacteria group bacterium Gr01-1014_18]|nr:MAG: iron compound ABC transporter ATP-binding protein [Parcubacteria group bacterium Greene0416_36]TSC81540.1 MAG: iron compound ABC transporter ATP-binding protein [Parcubacteria group bacterium Gr01-1014_18]TSC99649.1 MAG: iron compound ABC transporter ATP-binding protein [Parcubacteria group bacterium Greene1014_20]TSD07100.1 MAG: iron compound ABC transporter ATP-binding protein [Parcubacteria group bacterium Greene0714_2]
MSKKNKILFSGGGTLGPVVPLLAVWQELRDEGEWEPVWMGTKEGPEKEVVEKQGIRFVAIPSGKMRRYWDWRNITDFFRLGGAFLYSLAYLLFNRPKAILTAGGFVAVPVVWAGWILRIPIFVHQQDILVGLANKLMAPFATKITTVFEKSLEDFPKNKAIWTGQPIRKEIVEGNKDRAFKNLNFNSEMPVTLIFGGGTGASGINHLVYKALPDLLQWTQVIHITGKGKDLDHPVPKDPLIDKNYRRFEFLMESMGDAYASADLVVSRAGIGSLSEIIALGKPSIIIPIPDSHQENNARFLEEKGAIRVLPQKGLLPRDLVVAVRLLLDPSESAKLKSNLKGIMPLDGAEKMAEVVRKAF